MGDLSYPKPVQSRVETLVRETEAEADPAKAKEYLEMRMRELSLSDAEQADLREQVERSVVLQKNNDLLTSVRTQIEAERNKPKEEASPIEKPETPADTKETPVTSAEKKFWNPTTWTPEEREKAAQIAVVGGVVIGGLLLLRWLGKKAKSAAETVKEKTGSVWEWLKTAVVLGSLTTLGYFGWRGYQKYHEKIDQIRAIDKKIHELKDTLLTLKDNPVATAEVQTEITKLLTLRKSIEFSSRKRKEASDEEESSNEKPKNSEQKAEEVVDELKKYVPENFGIALGIAQFFGENNSKLTKHEQANQIHDIITNSKNKSLVMKNVFGAHAPFEILGEDRDNRILAGKTISVFCEKQRARVIAYLQKRDGIGEKEAVTQINEMTLQEYLDITTTSFGIVIKTMEVIREARGDVAHAIEKMDMHNLTKADDMIIKELEQAGKDYGLSDQELSKFSSTKLLEKAAGMTVGTVNGKEGIADADTPEGKVLEKIFEDLKTGDTYLYMLPCFHGIFPSDDPAATEEQQRDLVKKYLLERMSPLQAVRMFLYARGMKKGNAGGLMMMQLEVLKFIAGKESGNMIREKKYQMINRIAKKITTKSAAEIAEEWENLNLKMDPAFMENAAAMMSEIFTTGVEGAAGYFGQTIVESVSAYYALLKEQPAIVGGTTTVAAVIAARQYAAGGDSVEIALRLEKFVENYRNGDKLDKTLASLRPYVGMISPADFKNAETAYIKIREALKLLPDDAAKDALYNGLRSCNNAHGTEKAWENFARLISSHPTLAGSEADDAARMFMTNPGMRRTIAMMRHPTLSRIPLFNPLMRMVHGGMNKTVDTAVDVVKSFRVVEIAIEAARAARNNETLLKLLQNPAIKAAAEQGNKLAQGFMKVLRLAAPGAKYFGKALILVDAVLIGFNEMEIAEAKKEGNLGKQQILEAKRATLSISGISGAALLHPAAALAAPIAIPVLIGGSLYANAIYDSIIEWEKRSGDWLKQSPEDLRKKLDTVSYGKTTIGHRTGVGYSPLYAGWRYMTSWTDKAKKENDEEDSKQFESVETINSSMRQEILAAYFIQTMQVDRLPNETDQQFQEKVTVLVRDRMNYIRRITDGTYDMSILGDRFFEQAGNYADLMAINRAQKTPELRYKIGSAERTLDMKSLEYATNDGLKNDAAKTKFLQTMHQYEQDLKPALEAIHDLNNTDIPLA